MLSTKAKVFRSNAAHKTAIFEKKFNKKSAGILKYFKDLLLNFCSNMIIFSST